MRNDHDSRRFDPIHSRASPGLAALAAAAMALTVQAGIASSAGSQPAAAAKDLKLRYVSRLQGCANGSHSAEIVAYDSVGRLALVTNAEDVAIDVFEINADGEQAGCAQFDLSAFGDSVQSVAVRDGLAVAVVAPAAVTDPGSAVFFDPLKLALVKEVTVGALPDMVTFNHRGDRVLVANEGEPRCVDENGAGVTDPAKATNPEGSVSIIPIDRGKPGAVKTVSFADYNGKESELRRKGVRVGTWPGATVAEDLEPEYITLSPDDQRAYVTLQENNAVAVIDVATAQVADIVGLGLKDHSRGIDRIDASDRDAAASIRHWPVHGMYMPDSIASFAGATGTYLVTANEGDAREYFDNAGNDEDISNAVCFTDETRVKDLNLAGGLQASGSISGDLQDNRNLGRLKVSRFFPSEFFGGPPPGNGDPPAGNPLLKYSRLASFGARSFSIWNAAGELVWDSGDLVARNVLQRVGDDNWVFGPVIGTRYTEGDAGIDDRSDDKGTEPEAIATGIVKGRTLVFLGLERAGGIMMFDVTNPESPVFLQWQQTRDVSPEGLAFIPADRSPTGRPLLMAAHEGSGTTVVFEIAE